MGNIFNALGLNGINSRGNVSLLSVILSLAMVGLMTSILNLFKVRQETNRYLLVRDTLESLHERIELILNDPESWGSTTNHPDNQVPLACVINDNCNGTEGPLDFTLIAGANETLANPSGNIGFFSTGESCVMADPAKKCPITYRLTLEPKCAGGAPGPCSNPILHISADLELNDGVRLGSRKDIIKLSKYRVAVMK